MADELAPEELRRKLETGDEPQVIDVREPAAFERGHLPGAENVPMTELPTRIDEIEFDDEVVVACEIGQASLQAVRLIESFEGAEGSSVWSLQGGMETWDGEVEADA
ncbi:MULTISPECIES: rhodanese-like domain-containing protein [Halolamina]|uniref:Rhodanese-related sulfurtransferase n=1 Tax=Halolamina pelagica TaxID=699431 RepID=A0A1I5P1B5_9EURY|nr:MULTISPECIES: rhodanese-like domain-containing protein [Halolamina]NHX36582.1 rhodanese-like domain-containing protein [Halolamina sp. R1-12]SFP27839.1 Rhodanese-related sulfurtransferase [Halolamina pelagica]